MAILIDGYNLLNAAGILSRGQGPGTLERARLALLNFLAESLDPEEVPRTTVVFDAHDPPWGMPRTVKHRGITVHFSALYDEADTQIEELIRENPAPRKLTVVSSDHRLQKAANRRKARAVDSDLWYEEVVCLRRERRRPAEDPADLTARPPVPLLSEDVDYWIRQFGGESELQKIVEEEEFGRQADSASEKPAKKDKKAPTKPREEEKPQGDIFNPFPPGYGEDLLEGEDL